MFVKSINIIMGVIMKDKIIKVFIERKIKRVNLVPNNDRKDDIQQHMLQKPMNTGYSVNTP
jgi:hypothetical protein